jgi:hypothetical protein
MHGVLGALLDDLSQETALQGLRERRMPEM